MRKKEKEIAKIVKIMKINYDLAYFRNKLFKSLKIPLPIYELKEGDVCLAEHSIRTAHWIITSKVDETMVKPQEFEESCLQFIGCVVDYGK